MSRLIRLGSRGSQLALWQSRWVKERLQEADPSLRMEITVIKTTGDKIVGTPLSKIGDKGLFTKELDRALLSGNIDLAVHSLKDVPTELPAGLGIAAVTERWDARDALISRGSSSIAALPQGAAVATGSLRRRAQLLHLRPDLKIIDLRGNLNTRFRKFDESDWNAMILAVAGVERLGWGERISAKIPTTEILPAVGQGSFALISRDDDAPLLAKLRRLNHTPSEIAARAERAFLRELEGGCQVPIGALAEVHDNELAFFGCLGDLGGKELLRERLSGGTSEPEKLGRVIAQRLLKRGGREILKKIRESDAQ